MAKAAVMQEGLKRLYRGDFNNMHVETQPDGSQLIKLLKDGDPNTYRFRVKNLYQENEELLEHEIVKVAQPKHIEKRLKEAKKDA